MNATVLADLFQSDPWLATAALALVAVVVALVIHHVGGHIARRATRQAPVLNAVLTAMEQPAGAAMPLFALQLVWQAAPDT